MLCKRSALLIAFALLPAALCAQDRKAALADELFTSMKMDKMMDQMKQQMSGMVRQQMQQQMSNLPPADRTKASELAQGVLSDAFAAFDWQKMKPDYIAIYTETFTEQELQGLVDFYKSPAGQAFIDKMPVVMNKSMQLAQQKMAPIMAQMQERIRKLATEVQQEQPKDGSAK